MLLDHAILGFLNYGPFSGYDLKKTFDRSVRHFWHADQSQIYQTLTRLVGQGHVVVELVVQEARPNRKLHRITDEGRQELRRWLSEKRAEEVMRKPFLVQSFFAGMLSDEEIIELFEARAQELRDRLETFEALAAELVEGKGQQGPPREQFFWYLTLDNGVWNTQAELDWIEDAITRIQKKEYTKGGRVLPAPRRKR